MKICVLSLVLCALTFTTVQAQFTRQDTLRGSITKERAWWDVTSYDLSVNINIPNNSIQGSNQVTFKTVEEGQIMQLDLQSPMVIDSVQYDGRLVNWQTEGNAHFIDLGMKIQPGQTQSIFIYYHGTPKMARKPPWDGGWTWTSDKQGRPFIATANQGDGASLWWPCKDHPSDEAEEVTLTITVPEGLTAVGNGQLKKKKTKDGRSTFVWEVQSPINNYGVNVNIGHYIRMEECYKGLNGKLDVDYYVLDYNEEKAKKQFTEAPRMLEAFEYWFGPYPFYEDGYKLVEVPYLGMEHQSSVTYGNRYQNGYLGKDLSQTGMGMLFDFIIVHESAHEWWANNITAADNADMWIHESFTHYAESLFLEYFFGKDTAYQYIRGVRSKIQHDRPIQGPFGVNQPGSGDMYYKGANILHTLRMIINDDVLWREILRGLNKSFYHQTVTADDVMDFISDKSGYNTEAFFNQYFQTRDLPVLEYRIFPGGLEYRWARAVEGLRMPVNFIIDGKPTRLYVTSKWGRYDQSGIKEVKVDQNYYLAAMGY
jgi:aminopeptidase N